MAALAALFLTGSAQAVHDLQFQLDGNTDPAICDTAATGGGVPNCSVQTLDWNDLFNADGSNTGIFNPVSGPFLNGSFVRDFGVKVSASNPCSLTDTTSTTFCTADPTTYATGSKDTLNISPGWQCNKDNNVNSKIDIMNAYASSYRASNGDLLIYFGMEKNKNNGDNNVAFWFLQGDATCSSSGPNTPFTGTHQDGDVLVVSAFTSGGGVSGIDAYRWAGGANGCIDSNDNPNPQGGCNGLPIGSGGDCKTASSVGTHPVDSICATTNSGTIKTNTNITTKWLTSDATLGVGHTVVPPDFFEGGIDITKEFAGHGGNVPQCFTTFLADTRSSQSLTATLFDFARGKLGNCQSSLSTQQNSGDPLSIGTGSVSSGTDTATLSITGTSTWGGTLTWYLCGPIASPTLCDAHGVQVTSRTVSNSSPASAFVSDAATLTSAGRYCWHAHFEPDAATAAAGVKPADDDGTNECFTVNPVTPTLTTSASCSASPCVVGSTLNDTATLTGTAAEPGTNGPGGDTGLYKSINATTQAPADSSISWTLFGPENGGCSALNTRAVTPSSITVAGDNTYGPVSYTTVSPTDPPGTYTFVASYPGDGVNTNAATPTGCPDTSGSETVILSDTTSMTSAQDWLPNDTGTVTSAHGSNLNGTLSIQLYDGSLDCSTGAVSGQLYTKTLTNASSPQSLTTSNTTFKVTASDSVSWLVKFTSTDPNVAGSSHCESTSLTITN